MLLNYLEPIIFSIIEIIADLVTALPFRFLENKKIEVGQGRFDVFGFPLIRDVLLPAFVVA